MGGSLRGRSGPPGRMPEGPTSGLRASVRVMRMLAFPRGINVGGRVVPMARLRALLEEAGFTGVRTVLASGNLAVDPPTAIAEDVAAVRAELERLMSAEWDYDAIVQVWPAEAVERALEDAPWDEAPPDVHHYLVLVDDEEVRARLLEAELDPAVEEIVAAEVGVYWRVPKGLTTKSAFAEKTSSARVKKHVTTRKLDTIVKLLA